MTCKVEGCTTAHVRGGNGYCNRHYLQIWSRGAIQPEREHHPICTVDGCCKATRSKFSPYCEMHYMRLRRNGSEERQIVVRQPRQPGLCDQCGCAIQKARGFVYCSERCQTRARRGRAEKAGKCVVCQKKLTIKRRSDARFCSFGCQRQARGHRFSLDWLGQRDNWKCHICGGKVSRKDASQDHLIPVSHGGPTTEENIALAHRACNSRRGAGRIPAQLRLM